MLWTVEFVVRPYQYVVNVGDVGAETRRRPRMNIGLYRAALLVLGSGGGKLNLLQIPSKLFNFPTKRARPLKTDSLSSCTATAIALQIYSPNRLLSPFPPPWAPFRKISPFFPFRPSNLRKIRDFHICNARKSKKLHRKSSRSRISPVEKYNFD